MVKFVGVGEEEWCCDKVKGANKCYSDGESNKKWWTCHECNFNLCENCMKVDMLMKNLQGRDQIEEFEKGELKD